MRIVAMTRAIYTRAEVPTSGLKNQDDVDWSEQLTAAVARPEGRVANWTRKRFECGTPVVLDAVSCERGGVPAADRRVGAALALTGVGGFE
jgi:hypothetical protein